MSTLACALLLPFLGAFGAAQVQATATDITNVQVTNTADGSVVTDTAPAFLPGWIVRDWIFYVGTPIADLYMPKASGGSGSLRYSLTPDAPAGLTFSANLPRPIHGPTPGRLTGTPTVAQAATRYTYTVTDSDGQSASLNFTIEIVEGEPQPLQVTGFKVNPVPGEPTKLDMSWDAFSGATAYVFRWRADGQQYDVQYDPQYSFGGERAGVVKGSTSFRIEAPDQILVPDTKYFIQLSAQYRINQNNYDYSYPVEASVTMVSLEGDAEPAPIAWLARFGRSVATQAVAALTKRFAAAPDSRDPERPGETRAPDSLEPGWARELLRA
ncbi:MAG: hypothetical protein F4Z28_08040 [Gammaproteobacteria bacterium]|nr:hypothetical protein [Gammaproteobacteria bacterium]